MELQDAFKKKKSETRLSLYDIEKITGVKSSLLGFGFVNGFENLDSDTVQKVAKWCKCTIKPDHRKTLEKIADVIQSDAKLNADAQQLLIELMQANYRILTKCK